MAYGETKIKRKQRLISDINFIWEYYKEQNLNYLKLYVDHVVLTWRFIGSFEVHDHYPSIETLFFTYTSLKK